MGGGGGNQKVNDSLISVSYDDLHIDNSKKGEGYLIAGGEVEGQALEVGLLFVQQVSGNLNIEMDETESRKYIKERSRD